MDTGRIAKNYQRVLEQIEDAARGVGREPGSVHLVVVTKTHPVEAVQAAYAAGAHCFGENYADEAAAKIAAFEYNTSVPAPQVEWHMIGHVQSRKAGLVCQYFHYLHSLDRLKLARALESRLAEAGKTLPVLLECNVSGEETKSGWAAWDETRWEALLPEIETVISLPHLEVRGLMTMAPFFDEAEPARPYFVRLRRLQEYLSSHFAQVRWDELSMGMSGDFLVAIQEGATWVRIGTAIMGPRMVEGE